MISDWIDACHWAAPYYQDALDALTRYYDTKEADQAEISVAYDVYGGNHGLTIWIWTQGRTRHIDPIEYDDIIVDTLTSTWSTYVVNADFNTHDGEGKPMLSKVCTSKIDDFYRKHFRKDPVSGQWRRRMNPTDTESMNTTLAGNPAVSTVSLNSRELEYVELELALDELATKGVTSRQIEALRLIAYGCTTGDIAVILGITPGSATNLKKSALDAARHCNSDNKEEDGS